MLFIRRGLILINPRVEINLEKIKHNTSILVDMCHKYNITVTGVTKVFCGDIDVAYQMAEGGVDYIADSRIANITGLSGINLPKILLRLPMPSEVPDVVKFCDFSLNSDIDVIKRISNECAVQHKTHNILLMADLGDLREGIWHENFYEMVDKVINLNNINISGIGTNLTCYGGVLPSGRNLTMLCDMALYIRKKYNIPIDIISGGNSSSLHLLGSGEMPCGINNLRIGEAIALGRETAYGKKLDNMYDDAPLFYGEIIEIGHKPSKPVGDIGVDAFGNVPEFNDLGMRCRAIIAAGRQDIDYKGLTPLDDGIQVLGASSDHLIIDITDSRNVYSTGSEVGFRMSYGCLLRAMTSPYVVKVKI